MAELKKCPFCGGEAEVHQTYSIDVYWCKCNDCNAETEPANTEEDAVEAWNRRVDNG